MKNSDREDRLLSVMRELADTLGQMRAKLLTDGREESIWPYTRRVKELAEELDLAAWDNGG